MNEHWLVIDHVTGDLMDEEEALDWLTDPENLESIEHIERVNRKMFERILKRSDFLAVFFCKSFLHLHRPIHEYVFTFKVLF